MNIKTTIAAAFIAVMPMAATAQEEMASCEDIGALAQVIMENRQSGTRLSQMMEVADGNSLVVALLTDAYNEPRWTTQSNQDRAVENFRNDVELLCYGQST